jgi:hypothetical protein
MTATIDFDFEPHRNACWTVAAILDGRVIAIEQFDVESAAEISRADMWAAIARVAALPAVVAANDAIEANLPDDMEGRLQAILDAEARGEGVSDLSVVFGMVSGGRITYNLSKGDLARAGARHLA